ncbi:MAG: 4Fe-4S double cluster binding domain-containing protein, partial [Pseudomonadota bacterium]
ISYLTIELKGAIPRDLRPAIGNRIYGCDDCLAVCPWNKFAQAANAAYLAAEGRAAPSLTMLAGLDDAGFRAFFQGGPVKRIGRARFLRNVAVALGNGPSEADAVAALLRLATDESPLVRAHAVWALARLLGREGLGETGRFDEHADVREEWHAAMED